MLHAIASGVMGAVIGMGITYLISLNTPPPWTLTQVLIAVGLASFFSAFCTAWGAKKTAGPRADSAPSAPTQRVKS